MSEAARQNAFWSYKPGYKLTPEESDAFDYGWRSAMRFMAQPRIPALDVSEPVKAGEHRERSAGKMPVCPNCGSNTQVWRTNTLTATGVFWCHRLGCECVVPGPDTTLTSTPVHKEPDQVAERYAADEPPVTWTEADHETMRRICEEYGRDLEVASECTFVEDPSRPGFLRRCHNPHGLVAFYTDAP